MRQRASFLCFFTLLSIRVLSSKGTTTVTTGLREFAENASVSSNSNVCHKFGCICEGEQINCKQIAPSNLNATIFSVFPDAKKITFEDCDEEDFDIGMFVNADQIESISLHGCRVRSIAASASVYGVHHLQLSNNYLAEWTSICDLFNKTPTLTSLDLSFNYLPSLESAASCFPSSLRSLSLSHNQISMCDIPPYIETLDLSANELSNVGSKWPTSLKWMNLSTNPLLQQIPPLSLPNLKYLNLDGCQISQLEVTDCPRLRHLSLRDTAIEVIDFDAVNAPLLHELDLSESHWLSSILGDLPANLRSFRLSNSLISYLPKTFFSSARRLREVKLMPNAWNCNECLIGWIDQLPDVYRPQLNCSDIYLSDCSIGVSQNANGTKKIVRTRYGRSAVLECEAFGDPPPTIEWWLVRPERLIGSYEPLRKRIQMHWSRDDSYRIILGGNLIIQNANKGLVERYQCIASNEAGNASRIVHFRLDYSFWYSLELFDSVFWGSVVASLLLCATSFILNILWIMCRKTGLWWIRRTERLSRVRNMVEALEKYRQRQMLNLHESYRMRIGHVRENYHQQVEQLRTSYASQVERFRDYRAAQMETMGQHLENIRDNYNQQMCRLREYGSRRVEQLWESYERQMNRVRTFSLQQRLKLMRQYKVKQRYVNSLFEKFGNDDPAASACLKQHSEATVLGPMEELEVEGELSRSSSYYSLPEYVMDEDGQMHCPSGADLSRMFNRHRQPSISEPRVDYRQQQPSTSRQPRRSRADGASSPSSSHSLRYRQSLHGSRLSASSGADTPSTSKAEDVIQATESFFADETALIKKSDSTKDKDGSA